MKTISVISILILSSCGKVPVQVDPEFVPYLERFALTVGGDTSGVSVIFDTLSGDTAGLCSIRGNERTIRVSHKHWFKVSLDEREALLYHELGHCVLNLGHKNELIDTCPKSIMYPYTFGAACYSHNKAYYYNELKGG